jgi:hypothetical protein
MTAGEGDRTSWPSSMRNVMVISTSFVEPRLPFSLLSGDDPGPSKLGASEGLIREPEHAFMDALAAPVRARRPHWCFSAKA